MLLHIGLHKTATSWLQQAFFPDPGNSFAMVGALFAARRELVWPRPFEFDADAAAAVWRPHVERLAATGATPVLTDERLSGNPFSGGYDSKELGERLAAVFPGARVAIVVREQRAMLFSVYDEYVREGGAASLEDFLHPRTRHAVPGFRFEYFEYHKLIEHHRALFGADRVAVLAFETLRSDPAGFARALSDFAGARLDAMPPARGKVNAGRSALAAAIERRVNPFRIADDLNGGSPLAVGVLWRAPAAIARLAAVAPAGVSARIEARWRATIAEAVRGRYAASNARVAALSGLDLGAMGYAL